MYQEKIITYAGLEKHISRTPGVRVMVGGCFDILHIGHIRYLQGAQKEGDIVTVALESDLFIEKRKKRKPFHTQDERAEILSVLDCVDEIILLPYFETESSYTDLVETVRPAVIAITEHDPVIEKKQVQARVVGARVITVVPVVPQRASSDMIAILEKME